MFDELFLYDIKKIRIFFKNNKNVTAYGNGSFYEKTKKILAQFNFEFNDVLYTKNNNIVSMSGRKYEDIVKDSSILVCSTFSKEITNLIKMQKTYPKDIKILSLQDDKINIELYKKELNKVIQIKHIKQLQDLKNKHRVRVIFFVLSKSIWKIDSIFKKMQEDQFFEPLILIIPHTPYGEERMWEDMNEAYDYFKNKKYPVIYSYNKNEQRWLTLEEIKPDIIFFTLPHNVTIEEYYENAYFNYLSCYAGYGISTVSYNNNQPQYNLIFHNLMYKIFVQNNDMLQNYLSLSYLNKNNLHLVIDNTIEALRAYKKNNLSNFKKVIWAPHHTILDNDPLKLSTFIKFSEYFRNIVEQKKFNIFLIFKPHPELKVKLYLHPKWGKEKTDEYYKFWIKNSNSSLEEGEYIELFQKSDAMILDSASFLAEYLFMEKPMLFLTRPETKTYLNEFGVSCIKCIFTTDNTLGIDEFIRDIVRNQYKIKDEQLNFIDDYYKNLGKNNTSQYILDILKNEIRGKLE